MDSPLDLQTESHLELALVLLMALKKEGYLELSSETWLLGRMLVEKQWETMSMENHLVTLKKKSTLLHNYIYVASLPVGIDIVGAREGISVEGDIVGTSAQTK